MSKLIVEMEIPQACRWNEDGTTKRCPIAEWGGACAVTKLFEPSFDNRPPWCPIKGVLPEEHGDLIDRDALKKEISVLQDTSIIPWVKAREYAEIAKSSTLNIIDDQHAVIEAERKDDEQ